MRQVAARCEAAEAEADALEAANEKLRNVLRETQLKLSTAEAAGRDSKAAASLESSRRATALSEVHMSSRMPALRVCALPATLLVSFCL